MVGRGAVIQLTLVLLFAFPSLGQSNDFFDSVAAQATQARESDRLEDAIKLYRQAVQMRPDWGEGWWYLGTIAYDRGEFAAAADALNNVVKLAPRDAKSFAMLGLSQARLGQNRLALQNLSQALHLGLSDDANMRQVVLFTQANLLLTDGAYGEAQQILDQLAQERKNPEQDLLVALGKAVLGFSSPEPRIWQQNLALLIDAGKAEMLAANRENRAARAAYQDLVKRFPTTHNVEFAYGRFLLNAHQDDEAVEAFKREIANDPRHLLARLGIAGTLLKTDPATGGVYAQQAVQLAPKLEEAHYLFGASLFATGQVTKAVSELEMAEHLNAKDPRVWFVLAKAYKQAHRDADAAHAREKFSQLSAVTEQ